MKGCQGFSLLEMLVVLLVVGLFSAMSVAWLDAGRGPAQRALEQLAAQARALAAQARHSGQVLGLRWNGQALEAVRWQTDEGSAHWVAEGSALKAWPEGLTADWPASAEPTVVFTPTGLAAPVTLNWHWPQGHQRWQWLSADGPSRVDLP